MALTEDTEMDWRNWFRKALEYSTGTQTTVAKKAGIPFKSLNRWLNAGPGEPSITEAIALATAMRLSLDEVFRGIPPDDDLAEGVRQLVAQAREQGRREALEHIAATHARASEQAAVQAQKRTPAAPTPKARRSAR